MELFISTEPNIEILEGEIGSICVEIYDKQIVVERDVQLSLSLSPSKFFCSVKNSFLDL